MRIQKTMTSDRWRIEPYKRRMWAIYDRSGTMLAVTMYRKGAISVVTHIDKLERRLWLPPKKRRRVFTHASGR